METVNIRPAAERDIPQLMDLMYEYIVGFYKCDRPKEEALEKLMLHLIKNPYEGIQFVAENPSHQLVGFSTLYFTFNTLEVKRMSLLYDLYVTSAARGQHIGEKLLHTCIDYIREHGYSHMIWETAHDNLAAQSLYDKVGASKAIWLNYEIK
ncbi:GNAT family N-acetyltransferase [Pseudobacillus wudalianchiensis]|uniref:GCN5 family acetyltransferase n=1 Tax=Pseudobacillus wudalianchiensis TaxID=1743143 RepID=A0A1B9ABR0_9BACI|nr:N-acetyltransferase [Bacillus wudalianchiensis]OCA81269.1 GCN5 family acetyltransferase [Bacillus wudalianchiensis]